MNSVSVPVFKYDIAAIIGVILVSIFVLVLFLFMLFSASEYLWVFLLLAGFVAYIKYSGKQLYKIRIVGENVLTFSKDGITFGEDFYPANQIEVVAIYLYAFDNFEYRDGFVSGGMEGSVYAKASGDKNKISFRCSGNIMDFNFYIDNYDRFCAIRKVLNDWAGEGINVVLKQPFDDDFIIREMSHYNTPSGS